MLLMAIFFMLFSCDNGTSPQEKTARNAVKNYLKSSPDWRSYEVQGWGFPTVDDFRAGTGTSGFAYGESKVLSRYSIVHKFRMKNGFDMHMSYDMRFFFSDSTFRMVIGMEYMSSDDPTPMFYN